jgi:cytochrome c
MTSLPSKTLLAAGAAIALLGTSTASALAQGLDGKALYTTKACITCHGPDGWQEFVPLVPRLDGQDKTYIIKQVKAINASKRDSYNLPDMRQLTKDLTDAELDAIADFLSKVKVK